MVLGSRPSGKPLGSWLRLPMGSLLSGETLGSWLKHPEHSQPAQGAVAVSPGTGSGADPCAAAGLLRSRDHGTPVAKRASVKRMRFSSCAVQAVVAWASCSMRSLKSSICVRRAVELERFPAPPSVMGLAAQNLAPQCPRPARSPLPA